jgi:hypothetical protein
LKLVVAVLRRQNLFEISSGSTEKAELI